ncbi:hypothetical protein DJ030_09735 [bacterium endosymbiont of Escarpia laminata]|nr:MAG: hypothetical protein DJ031_14725 [bacterium endosymbiont of Escarpia laminata]RLJ19344.1 MAG: hypothetical protein DJ030_09735 [bacterium endosymbiont of Escarpia laminata]
MGAGAISSNAPRLSTFAAFLFPLLLPIAGILLAQKEGAYDGLGLLLLLYPSLLFLVARNYHNTIRESLGYRFKNQALLDELSEHVEQLQDEVAARQETQAELSALNETLEQRVSERANELQVLYLVSSILANPASPLEEVFNAILMSVLSSWSDERETCARITFNDECYQTEHYQDGPQKVSVPIIINGEAVGAIDIVYLAGGPSDESELFEYGKGSLLEAISQDISSNIEHRLSLEERQSMEVQLRHAQKLEAVGQLAAGIAHEINTPTQFVNDNTHFLREAFADYGRLLVAYDRLVETAVDGPIPQIELKEVKELAEEIDIDYLKEEIPQAVEQSLEGLGRIARIVQAMKEFSHPGTAEKTPTDLNRMIETTIDVSRNEWKYSAELITALDPALPQVPALAGEFNQVMLNLIVNAAHAITDVAGESGEKGEIRITTRQDGEWAEIRVSDTGKGIPEAIQKRIFDPFFTTKEVGKGSGQGLTIAWSAIVDKHDGTIDVESEEGKGTTFTIRLPIMQNVVS